MYKFCISFLTFNIFILVVGCKHEIVQDSGTNPLIQETGDITNVEEFIVVKSNFTLETWCNGSLQASQKALVPFEVQGNLVNVLVKNGQWVTKGQTLAIIDDYKQKQVLSQSEVNFKLALINYNDQLLVTGYRIEDTARIPKNVKEGAMLRSGLSQAILELSKARNELANTRITAPVNGMVAGLTAKPFTPTTEYKNFCTLLDTRDMMVNFDVLEQDATLIKPEMAIEVLPVAMPGSFSGKIEGADQMLSNYGTLSVSALVPNPKGLLIDGMKVKVVVKKVIPDQIVVPKSAVLARQNRQVVFTVEDGHAIWNYVTTGYENSSQYTITEGLKPGQHVIVSNNLTIGHMAPVLVSGQAK
ncbi:MAG: efflux RND transporter periplasmic adaptor subunit [Chloroflexota bacterium]